MKWEIVALAPFTSRIAAIALGAVNIARIRYGRQIKLLAWCLIEQGVETTATYALGRRRRRFLAASSPRHASRAELPRQIPAHSPVWASALCLCRPPGVERFFRGLDVQLALDHVKHLHGHELPL